MFIQEKLVKKVHAIQEALPLVQGQAEVRGNFHSAIHYAITHGWWHMKPSRIEDITHLVRAPYRTNDPKLYGENFYEPNRDWDRWAYAYRLKSKYEHDRPTVAIKVQRYYYNGATVVNNLQAELADAQRDIERYKGTLSRKITELQARLAVLQ